MTTFNQNAVSIFGSLEDVARALAAKERHDTCMERLKKAYSNYTCVTVQEEPFRVDLLVSPFDHTSAAILTDGGMLEGQILFCDKVPFNLMHWNQFVRYMDYYPTLAERIRSAAQEHGIKTVVAYKQPGRTELPDIPGLKCLSPSEFSRAHAHIAWQKGWPCMLVQIHPIDTFGRPEGFTCEFCL